MFNESPIILVKFLLHYINTYYIIFKQIILFRILYKVYFCVNIFVSYTLIVHIVFFFETYLNRNLFNTN